jgi:uncharacterized protein YutE (UPF0331/DUF86 family)/predicted nucleotidyltransferase
MDAKNIEKRLSDCLSGVLERYPVALAYLYGSAAVGQATPLSDVDIALVVEEKNFDPAQRLDLELKIEDQLVQASEIADLDVRIINQAPIMVRGEVVTNGFLLYSWDEKFRVEFETTTRAKYFDFMPAAALHTQATFDRLLQRGLSGQRRESYKLLRHLEAAIGHLNEISRMEKVQFMKDGLASGAAKYYLQTAIGACLDIGNHIISSEGFRSPKDYRDVFNILNEQGILPDETIGDFRNLAGLRNRLVHLYWEVDDDLIYMFLRTRLGDFENYARMITGFLDQLGLA